MELREFFAIFGIHKKIFLGIIIFFTIGGILFYFLQEQTYKTYVTFNITRTGTEKTNDYTYDNFYRLEADSKFADTVVEWTKMPYILDKVLPEHNGNSKNFFNSEKLSSQVIEITFITTTQEVTKKIAQNLENVLNVQTQKLNQFQHQENWFIIIGNDIVTVDNKMSLGIIVLLSFCIGFFIAFWTVLIKHYIQKS